MLTWWFQTYQAKTINMNYHAFTKNILNNNQFNTVDSVKLLLLIYKSAMLPSRLCYIIIVFDFFFPKEWMGTQGHALARKALSHYLNPNPHNKVLQSLYELVGRKLFCKFQILLTLKNSEVKTVVYNRALYQALAVLY